MTGTLRSADEGLRPRREKTMEAFFLKERPLGCAEGGYIGVDDGRLTTDLDERSCTLKVLLAMLLKVKMVNEDETV